MKSWMVWIVVFLLWAFASSYWYVCEIKCLCAEQPIAELPSPLPAPTPPPVPVDTLPPAMCAPRLDQPYTVHFVIDSLQPVLPSAFDCYLDSLAALLNRQPSLNVRLEGHVEEQLDSLAGMGDAALLCSTVADRLVARGVRIEQMHLEPLGSSRPIAKNLNPTARRLNRRVVIALQE